MSADLAALPEPDELLPRDVPELAQRYELAAVDTLTPHPDNPRRGDVDVIGDSIAANGFYGALVVQQSTGYVLAGNHRLLAAREHGLRELPVIRVDVDDATATRILLADNKTSDDATYDNAALLELLSALGDVSGTGYADADVEALATLIDDEARRLLADDFAADEYARFDREAIIDAAFAHYRERGFPYRSMPLHEQMRQINALAATETAALVGTTTAYQVADAWHPLRWHVEIPGKHTPVSSFEHDRRMRVALGIALDSGAITDASLLSALGMVRNSQAAANFRPGFALYVYRRYAPDGGAVLDTSTGFGGRLVGYAASHMSRYVGIDPNSVTTRHNRAMCDALGIGDVELIGEPAEDVDAAPLRGRFDLAFTSPPYFAKEHYSDEETQSWRRYDTGTAWRDGFLRPMLRLQFAALRPGARSVVNIADVDIDGQTYPLPDWTCTDATDVGFDVESVERFPLSRVPGRGEAREGFEPLIVLRKPDRKRTSNRKATS